MEKIKRFSARVLGALGWLLLGALLMKMDIGPWWVGWVPFTVAICVMAYALDEVLSPESRWQV